MFIHSIVLFYCCLLLLIKIGDNRKVRYFSVCALTAPAFDTEMGLPYNQILILFHNKLNSVVKQYNSLQDVSFEQYMMSLDWYCLQSNEGVFVLILLMFQKFKPKEIFV